MGLALVKNKDIHRAHRRKKKKDNQYKLKKAIVFAIGLIAGYELILTIERQFGVISGIWQIIG